MNAAGPKSAKIVGSSRNALRILDWLSRQERPVRLADVAGTLALNPSTCLNILHTLAEDGFVQVRDRTYALGPEAVAFAYRALETVDDFSRVQQLIERFSRQHGMSVVLWRIEENDVVAISSFADPSALLAVNVNPMRRMPMLTGSVGRLIAGFMPMTPEMLRTEFERANWPNLTYEKFMAQVADAKEAGFAMECGDYVDGIHALAAPIIDTNGGIYRAVSLYALANELPKERMPDVGNDLRKLAQDIGIPGRMKP
jgi:DNA-binding IclR family transcriptional regulator